MVGGRRANYLTNGGPGKADFVNSAWLGSYNRSPMVFGCADTPYRSSCE
jgi:hypothetical protein